MIKINNASFQNFNLKTTIRIVLIVLALLVFGLPLLSALNPFYTVDYGTVGVVTRFGKIDRTSTPGLNIKIPLVEKVAFYTTQKIIYETSEQPEESPYYNADKKSVSFSSQQQKYYSDSADYPVDTTTMDGQQVSIRFTLRYRLDPEKILWIAENIGTQDQITARIIQAQSRSVVRNIAREFPATNLYTGDIFTYQNRVADKLNENFKDNGIILDEFLVRQIKFADQYVAAVEQKQIEQEKVKTEEFKAQQEEFIKQQKIIRSEGEAKAQELLAKTIDPLVLQKMAIEKWDGILPTYLGGNGEIPMINIK
jgi:regulator of protease activity HflC (stomatin/prohibitin superfamily)